MDSCRQLALLALTSLRGGKRSVPESKLLSPSWESRDSRPEKRRADTVRGRRRSGSLCTGREGKLPPSFLSQGPFASHLRTPQVGRSTPNFHLPLSLCPGCVAA